MTCFNVAGSGGGGAGWISRFRVNYTSVGAGPDGRRTQPQILRLCRRQHQNLRKKTRVCRSVSRLAP